MLRPDPVDPIFTFTNFFKGKNMLTRTALQYLKIWQKKSTRKPLVIRGARQVGKSYLVRIFAKDVRLELIEINFEFDEDYKSCFLSKDPRQICNLIELKTFRRIG